MAQQSQKPQEKLLNLLIHDRDLFEDFLQNKNALTIFDKKYATLLKGMQHALTNSVCLTRESYKGFVNKESGGKHVAALAEDAIFVQIAMMMDVDKNDFPHLVETVQENYIKNKTASFLESFQTEKDKSYKGALRNLSDSIEAILSEGSGNKYKFYTIKSYFDEWYQGLVDKKNNPQKRLLTGIKEIDESMQTGLTPGQLTLFVAEPGGMKCVPGFSLLNCEDGTRKSVDELIALASSGKVLPRIQSLNKKGKLYYQQVAAIGRNGIKRCYRVKTSRGYSIAATGNHPILSSKGYVNIDNLCIGDRIALVRKTNFGNCEPLLCEAAFLGAMISDGGTTSNGYRFTNYDVNISDKMHKSVEELGGRFTSIINNKEVLFGQYHISGCRKIGLRFDIDRVKSINKRVPDSVFGWTKTAISEFLKMAFSCDGSFVVDNDQNRGLRYSIRYHTASLKLAEDIRDLLLKYSIVSILKRVRHKVNGEDYFAYTVSIRDASSIVKFVKDIGFIGNKQQLACEHIEAISNIKNNPNHDTIPAEFWNTLKCRAIEKNVSFPRREHLGIGRGPLSSHGGVVSRDLFCKLATFLEDEEMQDISKSDIYWDRIESIDVIGEYETYDVSMPNDHNFVCDNIITHNSMMMMNIALNVFMDFGEPILFVSLEMTRDKVMNRIISRETNIDLQKLSKPELLSDEELAKVLKAKDKWEPKLSEFGLIDNEERMTVGEIKRFIEKNQALWKFKLVVIDYIAILQPDERYARQNEHSWAGEMCKDLRQLGRKHGFSIISAVQLGKESLKRLKQQKQGKQSAGVEDMRGSHDYSADADNIYIQWPHPNEPTQKLCLVCAKARDGKKTFINDSPMAVLDIKPNLQKICTDNVAKWQVADGDPIKDIMYQKYGSTPPKIQDLDDLGDAPVVKPISMSKKIKSSGETSTAFLDI